MKIIDLISSNNFVDGDANIVHVLIEKEKFDEQNIHPQGVVLGNNWIKYYLPFIANRVDFNNSNTFIDVRDLYSEFQVKVCSCKDYYDLGFRGNGLYKINPLNQEGEEFDVYCDMDNGGWTLVWSHIYEKDGYPAKNLDWDTAINAKTIFDNEPDEDLDSFQVYTGLDWWSKITKKDIFEFKYSWAANGVDIDQEAIMTMNLNPDNKFQVNHPIAKDDWASSWAIALANPYMEST